MKSGIAVGVGLFIFFILSISVFSLIPYFQIAKAETVVTGEPSSEDPDARQWARPSLYKKGRAKTVITNIHGIRIVNIRYIDLKENDSSAGMKIRPENLGDLLGRLLRANEIEFRSGSTTLTDDARRILDQAAIMFSRFPEPRFYVEAHTDSFGSESINLELSEKRADQVVRYLERSGVRKGRLAGKGFGETRPIASNSTKKGRRINRRINFTQVDEH